MGIEMGRVALAVMAVLIYAIVANNGFSTPEGLEDKIWLVAIFPAVYILGLGLLRE
ncbi:MAG: hypothetical protein AB7O57_09215 [Hyphomicrobiaceae bacterium]